MRAGRMRHQITVQQWAANSPPTNAAGEPSGSWATYAEPWAEMIETSGREILDSGLQGVADAIFRIWFDSGITYKMRISYNSLTYEIVGLKVLGYNEGLEIAARALVD